MAVNAAAAHPRLDVDEWPAGLCTAIWGNQIPGGDGRRLCAEAALIAGTVFHTDFTGQQCAETGFKIMLRAARAFGANLDSNAFMSWCGSDILDTSQRAMLASSTTHITA